MENKDKDTSGVDPVRGPAEPVFAAVSQDADFDPGALSAPVDNEVLDDSRPIPMEPKTSLKTKYVRLAILVAAAMVLVAGLTWALVKSDSKSQANLNAENPTLQYGTIRMPLTGLTVNQAFSQAQIVTINGTIQAKGGLVISPSLQPASPKTGQIYFDQNTNKLTYFNGSEFTSVAGDNQVVRSLGGVSGDLTLGGGLSIVGNQLIANIPDQTSSVLSVGGQAGDITLGNGLAIDGNALQNSGVVSLVAGTSNIDVTSDGNGNYTVSSVGAGTGTVASSGGTTGLIPLFTGPQNIEDSILSQSGATVTVGGNLSATGSLSLGTALAVTSGGTGANTLTANGVLLGNGTSSITSLAAGAPGLCLTSTAGAPVWGSCSSGGVLSVDGLTGNLTIANSTGLGSTITIDDASTSNKGIVQFNGTNFSVGSGVANTIQNINTAASPTFNGLTLSGDLAVNGGDITSTGALNLTPTGSLTAGSVLQAVTIQGNASSTFVINGVTVDANEFNLLDGHDAALVDTNDAVNTAITGTGTLNAGSISSGFGAIDTGADNITTTGTLQGVTSVLTQSLDRNNAGVLNIGASNATNIVLGKNTSLAGASTFASGTGLVFLQGNTDIDSSVSLATKRAATYTTAGSANNVALNVASLYILDTAGAAQTITGIAAGRDGQLLTLVNADAALTATLSNNSGSSSAANRIITGIGSDLSLAAGASINLIYDSANNLWRVIGGSAGGTCFDCANTALSNLATTNINAALNATSANLNLTTTTSGNIVLNAAGTIDLQNNTNVTGTLGVSSTLTVSAGGASIAGNTTVATTAGNTLGLGNSTGTLTVTGNGSSTFVINGATIDATEFNRLDGKDAALVDTNDAVNTAIIGTGALSTGSITSGFGSIDTGGDNITTTGTLQGTTGVLTQSLDRTSAGALNIGASTATSIVLGKDTSLTGSATFTSGTGAVLLQGNTDIANTVSLATRRGATYTTAGSANDVALSAASLYVLDTSGAAQTITGIASGRDGQILTLVNADAALAVTLSNNSGSSSAANRIATGTGSDVSLTPGASATLIYDTSAALWRVIGGVAGGICNSCANQQLSNLSSTNINTALNATSGNLNLTTTTSGNIVLNSAGTIDLQDNTSVTGTLGVSSTLTVTAGGLTVSAGGASIAGNATIATTAGNTLGLGNSTGAVTVTGSSGSTFVLDGVTISTAEFNLLDGHDAALVDTNDAVNTAITGTGALGSGSITSGFGAIDTGADNITTTGTLQGTTSVLTQSLDRTSAGALNIGASTATSIVLGKNTSLTGAATFTSGTGAVLLQGNTDIANTVSLATNRGATYTTAGSANDVALNVASLYVLDTSGSAQTITGIAAGRDGQLLTLVNADAALPVTLSNNSGSSSANNRISTGTGADAAIPAGGSIILIYDTANNLWRVVGGVAGGGGTCLTCANQQLSNLSGTNINAALNATSANLNLTTTTSSIAVN